MARNRVIKRDLGDSRIWLAVAIGVAMAWTTTARAEEGKTEQTSVAEVGKAAPAFTLKDAEAKEVSLADFKGKVVVLEWINQQCPVSRGKHQDRTMQKAFAQFKDRQVVWLGIDSSHYADPKANAEYAKKMGLEYPILHDQDGKIGKTYGARTTPHMFVIDKEGQLAYAGAIDNGGRRKPDKLRNYVAEAVEALLNDSVVPNKSTKPYGCSVKYGKPTVGS